MQDDRDNVYDEVGVANDVLDFLIEFMEDRPEYLGRDFYVTGPPDITRVKLAYIGYLLVSTVSMCGQVAVAPI